MGQDAIRLSWRKFFWDKVGYDLKQDTSFVSGVQSVAALAGINCGVYRFNIKAGTVKKK